MNYIVFCPLIVTAISLVSAVINTYLYAQKMVDKAYLSLAFLSLTISFYGLFVHLTRRTQDIEAITFWFKSTYVICAIFVPFIFFHFTYCYIKKNTKILPWVFLFFIIPVIIVFWGNGSADVPAPPMLIHVTWCDYTYVIPTLNPVSQFLRNIILVYGVIMVGYCLLLLFQYYRLGNTETSAILITALIFYFAVLHDILVITGVYSFVFLTEYGGLIMIAGMAFALFAKFRKANEEMKNKQVLSAIGLMATEVVHDLSSPLSAIKMAVGIAREDGLDREQQIQHLSFIERETRRLSDMVFNILQYIKNDDTLNLQKINLKDYMDEIIPDLEPLFRKQGVELQFSSEYHGNIDIDPDKFKRVVLNLSMNALEGFSGKKVLADTPPQDRTVSSNSNESNRLSISATKYNGEVHTSFHDNGPGIPKHLWPDIFEPFTSQGKKFGTGLGLAIAKQIVEHHNGKIFFESDESGGTLFRIELPLHAD